MEYTQELRRELTKFERIVLELAERVQGAAGEPAGFRAAVTALRGALDQVGRAAFLTLVARSEEAADTVVDEAGTVHSFPTLLDHLGTIVHNWVRPSGKDVPPFMMVTQPNPLQRRAFELLGLPIPK